VSVGRRALTVRTLALFGAASAAIHQLRYAIGYGAGAPHALAAHPHGYLSVALPGIITAALIALASVLLRVAGARGSREGPRGRSTTSLRALWLGCALALAAIYGIQETLEGAGAFAGSGWIGLALAVPAGLLVALALRGAHAAEALRGPTARLRIFFAAASPIGTRRLLAPKRAAVAAHAARGPPLTFVV
jgi:hypothetical protein